MKIGLDFDDVITQTEQFKRNYYEKAIGVQLPFVSKELIVGGGHLDADGYRALQKQFYADKEAAFENLELVKGAIKGIRTLQTLGHEVSIVTARSDESLDIAQELLVSYGINLPFTGVGYGNSKKEALAELDVFIDDDPEHLLPIVGENIRLFLMSNLENQDFSLPNIIRVNSWEEFLQKIVETES